MIYLLRHGSVGRRGVYLGQADWPLSPAGKRQARRWRDALASAAFDRIYSSDLARARGTADIIAAGQKAPVTCRPELREIKLGALEGLSRRAVQDRYPQAWKTRGEQIATYRPSGGESFRDLRERVVPLFESLAAERDTHTLIVAHAGVNRVLLCHVLGLPLRHLFRIGQDEGAMNLVDVCHRPRRVITLNAGPEGMICRRRQPSPQP
jgi:probable phosphoglycerate mutase